MGSNFVVACGKILDFAVTVSDFPLVAGSVGFAVVGCVGLGTT